MAVDYNFEIEFGHPLTWADPLNITWSFFSAGQPTDGVFQGALPPNSVFTQDIIDAFDAWAAVANLNFIQIADNGTADIRLGWQDLGGPGGILGITQYGYDMNSHFTDVDITFDMADPWMLSGGDQKSQGAPFYITALHEIGHALGLDHYNTQSAVMNAFIDPTLTGLTSHDIHGIVALYGAAEDAPIVSAMSKSLLHNTTVLASSLFTAADADGDAIVTYRFEDTSAGANSGHWVVNGVVQAANSVFEVAAANLATVSFVVGTSGADTLKISASDSTHFGQSTSFTITASNVAPVVTATNQAATHGQIFTAAQLFGASDADGDAIVSYQIIDKTTTATSGHWDISGTDQAAGATVTIAAASLGTLTFETGSGSDILNVRAYDGVTWGAWKSFTVTVPADRPAVVTAANLTATHGQVFTAAQLFAASDADGDAIVSYQITDKTTTATSGHWDISGVDQLAGKTITVDPANLGNLTFESGSGADTLSVRAFDGYVWGAWTNFTVKAPVDIAPIIAAPTVNATHGQVFTAAQLFGASDADGDTIVSYQITDKTTTATSGHWDISGTDQLAGKTITVDPADLGNLTFESGSGTDMLSVRAFDGYVWGAWTNFSVKAPVDIAPVITATNLTATHGQVFTAAQLFGASDADGDAIASYQITDKTTTASSGHWDISGTDQLAGKTITVDPANLGNLTFESGSGTDTLSVRAFDGYVWGAWTNFTVKAPVDIAPVIAATNLNATHGQVFTAAQLFGVSDADGDSIVSYQISDKTTTASSGHWDISGTDQLAGKTITVAAADLGHLTFESGSGADTLTISAFDGYLWSAVKTIKVTAPDDHAPVVAGGGGSVLLNSHTAASALFSVSDVDGDAITRYQLQDKSTAAASGHWEVGGVIQAANHPFEVAAADLANVEFVGGSIAGIDHLMVRAYDDMMWGSWHNFDVNSHA